MTTSRVQQSLLGDWDELTSSPAATPASHSVLPGSERARMMTATSGRFYEGLLTKPDRVTSWLRTLLGTSAWDSTLFWLKWKATVTPSGRLLFRLVPSTPSTVEIASGSWPTPTMVERPNEGNVRMLRAKVQQGEMTEAEATSILGKSPFEAQGKIPAQEPWPTPVSSERANRTHKVTPSVMAGKHGKHLSAEAMTRPMPKSWPTPTTIEVNQHGGEKEFQRNSLSLTCRALQEPFPTPMARDWKGDGFADQLPNVVKAREAFPTPNASDNRDRGNLGTPSVQRRMDNGKQVMLSMAITDQKGMKLHGEWTLALMGFPPDWCEDLPPDPLGQTEAGKPISHE